MIAYWDRDCEWMGDGLQLAICPSFTGPTSLQALDVSGRSNHGTLTNMDRNTAWVTSGGKGALDFAGTNGQAQRIEIGRFPALENAVALTFSFWSKWSVNETAQAGFFSYAQPGGFADDIFMLCSGGSYIIQINNGADGGRSLSAIPSGNWDHFAVVYSNSSLQFYINGNPQTLAGTYSYPATTSAGSANHRLWIGGYVASSNFWFLRGGLDDFRINNRALTAREIRQLYERDRGGGMLYQPPSRRSYYAQLAAAFSILAESGSYALTGQPIPLLYGRVLPADTGSVLLSGQATPLLTSRLLSADQGSYAATGNQAATLLGRLLDAGAAAYTLDGTAAGLLASRRISADTVAYLASGLDAGFLRSRVLEAGTGQYVVVASPVNITTGTGGAAPYYYLFLLGGSR